MPVTTRAPAIVAFLRDIALAATCAVTLLAALPGKAADAFTTDYLALADAAIADGMFSSAEDHLVKYLALNHAKATSPEYRHALSLLCQVLAGLRRYNDIIGLLDRNTDVIEAGDRRVFDYWRAYAVLESGNPADALRLIDPDLRIAAKTNDTANLQLVRLAAEAYSRLNEPDSRVRAEEMIGYYLLNAPKTTPVLPLSGTKFLQAKLMARGGKRDKAMAIFKTLASLGSFAHYVLGVFAQQDDAPTTYEFQRLVGAFLASEQLTMKLV